VSTDDRVRELVEPLVAAQGLELFDLEHQSGVLKISVDRPGGADMEAIAAVTRAISRALDEHDPIAGRYTLEVSSLGIERVLRTQAHFRWAEGRAVVLKTVASYEGDRRMTGTITASDADGVVVARDEPAGETLRLAYDDIDKARTVFEWGGEPKPSSRRTKKPNTTKRAKAS
jgi:ribosome maturation factor RimP